MQASAAAHRIADGDLATRLPATADGTGDELDELSRSINAMAASLERARRSTSSSCCRSATTCARR